MATIAQRIKELKKQFGLDVVFHIKVDDKEAFFKKPDRQTLGYAMSLAQKDPLGFAESILRDTYLEGDKDIYEDVDYLMGASTQIDKVISIKSAEVKKH